MARQIQAFNRPGRRRDDGGAVLLTVLLVMLALLGLGVTGLWLTSSNLQVSANANLRNQALYVAEAGIEAVWADLNGPVVRMLPELLAGGRAPGHDDVPTGVDGNGQPNGLGAVYFHANGTVVRDVPFPPPGFQRGLGGTTPMSSTMGSYTVWIRNDTGELRQGNATVDSNSTIVVRSRGLAADGSVEVVLEVTMGPGPNSANTPVLCHAGKNACDDNSSTLSGIFVR